MPALILSRRQSLAGIGLISAFTVVGAVPVEAGDSENAKLSDARVQMRKLWEDHITYTRNYIISALAELPDADAVAERLLRNQDDLGNAITPFYGEEAGQKLAALLKEHIMIATEVVKAAKANDEAALEAGQKKWSENGADIAAFLSEANPAWAKADLESMLQKHLDLTTGEVVGRLKEDWAADIKSYDEGHEHMLHFADMLTEGIAQQFPDKVGMALSEACTLDLTTT